MLGIVDLTWLLQRGVLRRASRSVPTIANGTGIVVHRRATKGERGLQLEWLGGVRGKGLPQVVDLGLHLWHGPVGNTLLQDPHVADEEIPSIAVELRIRGSNGNLDIYEKRSWNSTKSNLPSEA